MSITQLLTIDPKLLGHSSSVESPFVVLVRRLFDPRPTVFQNQKGIDATQENHVSRFHAPKYLSSLSTVSAQCKPPKEKTYHPTGMMNLDLFQAIVFCFLGISPFAKRGCTFPTMKQATNISEMRYCATKRCRSKRQHI